MKLNLVKILFFAITLFFNNVSSSQQNPSSFVNPFIGTSNGGNTYPGAVVPWGMVSVSPHNNLQSKSGYFYGEPYIYGFEHTHLSGTGCQDFGNVVIMPLSNNFELDSENYKSNYKNEIASSGYYKADLLKDAITAEMTATERVGISKYSFSSKSKNAILLDGNSNLSPDKKESMIEISKDGEIKGWTTSGSFCGRFNVQKVYFVLQLNHIPKQISLFKNNKKIDKTTSTGDNVKTIIEFNDTVNSVLVKVGISYVSIENAKLNLLEEAPHWNFKDYVANAKKKWDEQLSKIAVKTQNKEDKVIFYSALYHMLLQPSLFNDVNGEYKTMESSGTGVGKSDQNRYHVFSLWDTYRTLHPLLTLVYPKQQNDMVQSMVGMYEENSWLPKWELAGEETLVMVGDPASIVISDTYVKGLNNFNVKKAWEATWKQAFGNSKHNPIRPGIEVYNALGYVPHDYNAITDNRKLPGFVWGAVSTSLEYYIADFAMSQFGYRLGKTNEAKILENRSARFSEFYDKNTKFLRPKNFDGSWIEPFDPLDNQTELGWMGSGGKGYAEGTAWQYNFYVPHAQKELMSLMGGEAAYFNRLKTIFDNDYFELSNEPDMSYTYLFNNIKSKEWVGQLLVEKYRNIFKTTPDGIPGNDDTGTISGWYVWSAMGIYPDIPGIPDYQITKPLFEEVTIKLDTDYYKGKNFIIKTQGNKSNGTIIKNMQLNNKQHDKYIINHDEITKGGELVIKLDKM